MREDIEKYLSDKIFPYREEKRRKDMDDLKTYEGVFDKRTLLAFYKILKRSVEYVEFPISTGKEGEVFRGAAKNGNLVAIKVYKITRLNYKGFSRYIDGDERFSHIYKRKDNIVNIWARKEFKNLQTYFGGGVSVPHPIDVWRNIVVMEYIGDESVPAPLLRECMEKIKKDVVYDIIEEMRKMLKTGIIHGDLSEYNILMLDDKPYIIDVAQGVPMNHPLADELLLRDLKNMVRVFEKMGVIMNVKELAKEIGVI